jgi:hypothetical protein
MARKPFGPRKQRTRQHVIADQGVNHVERFIIDAGHRAQRFERDYSYDLLMSTYDEDGYLEPGATYLQLKAAETLRRVGARYVFDVDIRDYNLWTLERLPGILVLFDASRRRAYWLHVQRCFREETSRRPKPGARTVRVRVPSQNLVNRRAIAKMRELKWQARHRVVGEQS